MLVVTEAMLVGEILVQNILLTFSDLRTFHFQEFIFLHIISIQI